MSTRSGEGETQGSPWAYCGKLTGLQMAHEVPGRGGQTRHRFEEAPIILQNYSWSEPTENSQCADSSVRRTTQGLEKPFSQNFLLRDKEFTR